MSSTITDINQIPNVRRFENFPKDEMQAHAMELTHAVYPHDEIYGQYCTLEEYIDCPPADVFRYLADVYTLEEWTYSLRDFEPTGRENEVVSYDKIGGKTRIYSKAIAHAEAMTVDYHCAWDQGEKLWMIYLMRVIPAQLVLDKPGSVVLWTNCRHPFYDKNPFPEKAPADRKVWVGDLWPFFYAGHHVELQNLKHILEYRHRNGLPINPREVRQ
ncbi:MAG TPA: hypothetical protein VM580_03110 [Labilithrix sp.]|jgi:hypothetical protein|nr:hypothetical protein [Labilithrix sp.]